MNPLWYFNQTGALAQRKVLRAQEFLRLGQARGDAQKSEAQGYAAGFAAGQAAASAELAGLALDTQRQALAIGGHAVELMVEMVQQVIGQVPTATVLRGLVMRALEQVEPDVPMTLRVAPASLGHAEQALAALEQHQVQRAVKLVADAGLADTDCILQTQFGSVNASLAVQLRGLNEAMQQAVQGLASAEPPWALP